MRRTTIYMPQLPTILNDVTEVLFLQSLKLPKVKNLSPLGFIRTQAKGVEGICCRWRCAKIQRKYK